MDTWILEMVRRKSARRVTGWAILLASITAFALSQGTYIKDFILGPPLWAQNDKEFRYPGYVAIVVALVSGFLFVKFARRDWKHFRDPTSHSLVARVSGWGDPISVAAVAERESHAPRFKRGPWIISEQFLIWSSFFSFDLLRLSDLVWAYKKVTQHSVNFIPTGKSYEGILICYGRTVTVPAKEKVIDDILGFAAQKAPWAVFGFTPELEKIFNKSKADFCTAVEQRKREWEGGRQGTA